MPRTFLRRLNSLELWADYRSQLQSGNDTYPDEIRAEIEQPGGMSVFKFTDLGVRRRTAAALMLIRTIKNFHGLAIAEDLVTKNGFSIQSTPRDVELFDTNLFKLHHDLHPNKPGDSKAFAEALALKAEWITYDTRELISFLRAESSNRDRRGHIFRESVSNPDTKKLMVRHFRDRYLELSHPN